MTRQPPRPSLEAVQFPEFRFDCPHCREPWAYVTQGLIDIHGGGALGTCADCGGRVVFDATPYHGPNDGTGHPA